MKIAYFGGTFDPVHSGHLQIARAILEQGCADRVVFVPNATPPHKVASTPFAARVEMLKLAIAGASDMEISEIESARTGRSFTYDTLVQLQQIHPHDEIFWVIGSDSLEELHLWYRANDLADKFQFLVYPRPGFPAAPNELAAHWTTDRLQRLLRFRIQNVPLMDIASNRIRTYFTDSPAKAEPLLPCAVYHWILQHHLYV